MVQKNNNSAKAFENLGVFESFIRNLKKDVKQNPTNDKYIVLFTLEIVFLEHYLKCVLTHCHDDSKYLERTLGRIIKRCESRLKMLDKNKGKNKLQRKLLDINYITSFIRASNDINDLRNTLFHNLFKDPQKNLYKVTRDIKKRMETKSITYDSDNWKAYKKGNTGLLDGYKSLITNKNLVPKGWTIEMLRVISGKYIEIARIDGQQKAI